MEWNRLAKRSVVLVVSCLFGAFLEKGLEIRIYAMYHTLGLITGLIVSKI